MVKTSTTTEIELIKQTLNNQTKMIEDIHHKLIGNGQPGLIIEIRDLKLMKEDYIITKKQVETLDKKIVYATGALAIIVILLNLLGPSITKLIFK